MSGVVFMDKDGTLIENIPFNVDPAAVRLAPGAERGLPRIAAAGLRVAVISNQPGVAFGLFAEEALDEVRRRLEELLGGFGVELAGFHYCPHHPDGLLPQYSVPCGCRKPAPGLIERAAREAAVDTHGAWLVGDILDDIEAGGRAGCNTILVDNGNETEWLLTSRRRPDHIVHDLDEASVVIAGSLASGVNGPARSVVP